MPRASYRFGWMRALRLLAIWSSIISAFPNLVAQNVFTVNGLSGMISPAINTTPLVFYPRNIVTVTISRANLLFYSYEIVLNKEQKLVQTYNIVGVGEVLESKQNQVAQATTAMVRHERITDLFKELGSMRDEMKRHQDALMNFYENPTLLFESDISWSEALEKEIGQWPCSSQNFRSRFRMVDSRLNSLYTDYLFQTVADEDDSNSTSQTDEKTDGSTNSSAKTIALIDTARSNLNQIGKDFNAVEAILVRWSRIVDEHTIPVLSQSFTIDKDSRRYTIQVKRRPLYDPQLFNVGKGMGENHDTTILASIPFEGHEKSRFNLSVGFAGMYQPDSYSYGIVGMPATDSTIMYKTQKTGSSRVVLKPMVLLSIYFGPIDDFDQNRPILSCRNFMFTIGTELNLPMRTYVVGVGYDFPFGLVVGGGATLYNRTVPANGWPEGQLVSSKNYSTVQGTLPTETKSALGYYVSVSFRPAIFDAFYGLLKPTQ